MSLPGCRDGALITVVSPTPVQSQVAMKYGVSMLAGWKMNKVSLELACCWLENEQGKPVVPPVDASLHSLHLVLPA